MAADIWKEIEGIDSLKRNCLSLSISDPCVKNLAPSEDTKEKLEDIFKGQTFDLYMGKESRVLPLEYFIKQASADHPSFSKARSSIIKGLQLMLDYLPRHIGIAVFEAYRPLWKQKEYHKKVLIEILRENSEISIEEAYILASQRVSEFIDNIFTHGTGGAIELTLFQISLKGERSLLDMGKFGVVFGHNEQKETFSNNITLLQRDNRLLLQKAALQAGFVGYAFEGGIIRLMSVLGRMFTDRKLFIVWQQKNQLLLLQEPLINKNIIKKLKKSLKEINKSFSFR